jgi:DNA-damage-inducible protein D
MTNKIDRSQLVTFESIRRKNENGGYYWSALELGEHLGYADFSQFLPVIEKAKQACIKSGHKSRENFVVSLQKVGAGAKRKMPVLFLSRYAGYLIVQSADPSHKNVALGQTYFAAQTRIQEIVDQNAHEQVCREDKKRAFLRSETRKHAKKPAHAVPQSRSPRA